MSHAPKRVEATVAVTKVSKLTAAAKREEEDMTKILYPSPTADRAAYIDGLKCRR